MALFLAVVHGVLVITDVTRGLNGAGSCSGPVVGVPGEERGPPGEQEYDLLLLELLCEDTPSSSSDLSSDP